MFKLVEPEKSLVYVPSAPCLMLLCTRKGLGLSFVTNLLQKFPGFCFNLRLGKELLQDKLRQTYGASRYKQSFALFLYDGPAVRACLGKTFTKKNFDQYRYMKILSSKLPFASVSKRVLEQNFSA